MTVVVLGLFISTSVAYAAVVNHGFGSGAVTKMATVDDNGGWGLFII